MTCINGFLLAWLEWGEIQCCITTHILQTENCILEKLQHWPGARRKSVQIRNVNQNDADTKATNRTQICLPIYLWGPDFPRTHKRDFKPRRANLRATWAEICSWQKLEEMHSCKAANNVNLHLLRIWPNPFAASNYTDDKPLKLSDIVYL